MEKRVRTTICGKSNFTLRAWGRRPSQRQPSTAGETWGLTSWEMLAVIPSLTRREFYKSMTSYADHRIWQDVYHAPTPVGKETYIKVTMRDAAPVIQFKQK